MSDSTAIDLKQVAKTYRGKVHALDGVDLRVERGEIFGLLGPNGAGKSTLVKIMMTIVRPSQASGTILGQPIGHRPTLARVGYLPENHRFPRYLTGRQTLDFFGGLSKVDRGTRRRRSGELLDTVGMTSAADRKIATYSKGMMQRIGLAQALMADPDLVVLDEPTDGVDPVGRRDIRDVLRSLRERGKTVFVNSHLLVELELFCDRIAILVGGRVARHGTLDEMTIAQQRYEIEIGVDDPARAAKAALTALRPLMDEASAAQHPVGPSVAPTAAAAQSAPAVTGTPSLNYQLRVSDQIGASLVGPRTTQVLPPVHVARLQTGLRLEVIGATIRLATLDSAAVQPALDALRAAGVPVRRLQVMKPSLEDLFLDIVRPPSAPPRVIGSAQVAAEASS